MFLLNFIFGIFDTQQIFTNHVQLLKPFIEFFSTHKSVFKVSTKVMFYIYNVCFSNVFIALINSKISFLLFPFDKI